MAAAAIPYIIMAVGTAAKLASDRNASKEKRSILNKAMERNNEAQQKANAQLVDEASNYSGEKRNAAIQAQQDATYAQSLKDIGMDQAGAGGANIDTAGSEGNVSGDFLKAKADRTISEGNRITDVARELAKVRAPGQQSLTDNMRLADVQGTINSSASTTRNLARAAELDAQNVQPSWWGKLGGLAAQAAAIYASGGAGAGAGAGAAGGASAVNGSAMNTATPRINMFG
jgi:hypothetical protein